MPENRNVGNKGMDDSLKENVGKFIVDYFKNENIQSELVKDPKLLMSKYGIDISDEASKSLKKGTDFDKLQASMRQGPFVKSRIGTAVVVGVQTIVKTIAVPVDPASR